MALQVLFEDNHLLAVAKPAGLLTQGDRSGDATLLDEARSYLKQRYDKPGNVYLGLVHRLDRNVSGLVLLARTSKAASRLSASFRNNEATKTYLAVCAGRPEPMTGALRHWLAAAGDEDGVTKAADVPFAGAREALLQYRVLEAAGAYAQVEVTPVTGRRHQIRVQLARFGHPLLGDVKYGSCDRLPDRRIALHAWRLQLAHPVGGRMMTFECPLPVDWPWPPAVA